MPIESDPRQALAKRLRPCPFCGGSAWGADLEPVAVPALENHPDGSMKVVTKFEDDEAEFSGIVAIPAVCGVCGYVALFHLASLLAELPRTDERG
jgi:hypothetical protein